jgi:hypothetical protein
MNQLWPTGRSVTFDLKAASKAPKNSVASAKSSTVVNAPSTVSLSMMFLTTYAELSRLLGNLLVNERCAHEAGADDVGAHAVLRTFLGDDLGEPDDAVLGGDPLSGEASLEWIEPMEMMLPPVPC